MVSDVSPFTNFHGYTANHVSPFSSSEDNPACTTYILKGEETTTSFACGPSSASINVLATMTNEATGGGSTLPTASAVPGSSGATQPSTTGGGTSVSDPQS